MWKNLNKPMLVIIGVGFILILSILVYYSKNQVQADLANIEPTNEIIIEIEMTANPVFEEHEKNELIVDIVDEVEEAPQDRPTDLPVIRTELSRKAKETFMLPGWLHIQIFVYDMLNPDKTVIVPETGQVIANSYVLENWYFMTDEGKMAAMYSKKQMLDGTLISLSLMSDGTIGPAIQPELIADANMDWTMSMQTIDRIISFGEESNLTIRFENREGIEMVLITTVDIFTTPVEDEDFPSPITEYTGTLFYDWNTGQLLYDEGWVTLADGTHLLLDKKELVVLPDDQVPDEVRFSFN